MTDTLDPRRAVFMRAAEEIWGRQWQTRAAEELEISDRHIRRLVSGEARVSPGMIIDLMRLILDHQARLDDLFEELKQNGGGQ